MYLQKLLAALGLVMLAAGFAHADLNAYIRNLNVSAEGNIGSYRTQLGVHYGTSGPSLDLVFRSVDSPGEAAIILWLGQRTKKPVETVVQVYQSRKGQGWGEIAKSLGIKPGSAEFHALRQGDLGKGDGKGKGRK
jgi:hypothetical protein